MTKGSISLTKIESGTFIQGNLEAHTDIRIDGEVEGVIKTSHKLFIGASGSFKGEASAQHLDLCGRFEGSLFVEKKMAMHAGAHFEGEAKVGSISIEEGAHFQGLCDMSEAVQILSKQPKTKQLHPEGLALENKFGEQEASVS